MDSGHRMGARLRTHRKVGTVSDKSKWIVCYVESTDPTEFAKKLQDELNKLVEEGYHVESVEPISKHIYSHSRCGGIPVQGEAFSTFVRAIYNNGLYNDLHTST